MAKAHARGRISRLEQNGPEPKDLIESKKTLADLKLAAQSCRGCGLWKHATQAVFGEGTTAAEVMLVGEQPGNREDLEGHPFVGPAGRLLDDALAEAGIARERVYVTNVVKHFKSTERGKLRIHKKPDSTEIAACRPWLQAEIERVRPTVIVCLGATAAQALISRDFRVSRRRGELLQSPLAAFITATVHPSSVLRAPDDDARYLAMKQLVADLRKIARSLPSSALK